ncbi:MAG: hypothetical protein P8J50_18530 [Acidimicrobiales bacterium]|nr:hypothetical protein [Acidimicrobiales bacterium]
MSLLPSDFADLEVFADWILPTEDERYAKRLGSTMAEMQSFYDTAFPRLEAIMAHAETVPIGDAAVVSDEDRNLAYLAFSLVTASFPVEAWKQPHVPDSGAAAFPLVSEPGF